MELQPYLFISGGKCEEALNFYKGVFSGTIGSIMRWKDGPQDMGDFVKDHPDFVMHSEFTSPSVSFMASDARPTTQYGMSRISLSLSTKDEAEAKRIFGALSQGGTVEMPLEEAFWGGLFGMITDKFDVDWMVNYQA